MPSAELKHSGVHQLVTKAVSPTGRVEREVKLSVEAGKGKKHGSKLQSSTAVPIALFGSHVENRNIGQKQPFREEYNVCLLLHAVSLAPYDCMCVGT